MKNDRFIKAFIAGTMSVCFLPVSNVHAQSGEEVTSINRSVSLSSGSLFQSTTTFSQQTSTVKGDYEKAINGIILPRVEKDGTITSQHVGDDLKKKLNNENIEVIKNETSKTLTTQFQIKDTYLASSELNGMPNNTGISFFNMLNFYTSLKQVKQLLVANTGFSVVDSKGTGYTEADIDKYLELVEQINSFDTSTNLKYNSESAYDKDFFKSNPDVGGTDVIATGKDDENIRFSFHIDSHGYWGYDLGAHDSITGLVMGQDEKTAYDQQHDMTTQYGNFFKIDMGIDGPGKLYMLKNTDLENPMIYVSEDGKEAFMIDVDFYGENVLNKVIKDVIGPNCESLKIYFTHNHGDHVNNLAQIIKDERLKKIVTVIWPENEPHSKLGDSTDLTTLFGEPVYVKDMQVIKAAGRSFQFVEIPNEHTPAGGQLLDIDSGILHSGDTLGAQVHLGGTSVRLTTKETINDWVKALDKSVKFIKDNKVKYIIGGHTGYLNNPEFATWVQTAVNYGKEQLAKDPTWKGLVIVENGKVVDGTRMKEMFSTGLTDREELNVASVNFVNMIKQEQVPTQKPTVDTEKPKPSETDTTPKEVTDKVKTDDESLLGLYCFVGLAAASGIIVAKKKKEENQI
ncbi:MAG: MBL fold metallo-hydrolase [Coprobacillus sp.]